MSIMPNSVEGRDIAYHMHPAVNLRKFEEKGGLVIERGEGVYVYDNNGQTLSRRSRRTVVGGRWLR